MIQSVLGLKTSPDGVHLYVNIVYFYLCTIISTISICLMVPYIFLHVSEMMRQVYFLELKRLWFIKLCSCMAEFCSVGLNSKNVFCRLLSYDSKK